MNSVAEILTAKTVAEIAWKALKEGYSLTKNTFREALKNWVLSDSELDIIANSINNAPESDKRTQKYLEAFLDDHASIRYIIDNAKASNIHQNHAGVGNNIYQHHSGSGDNVVGNKMGGQ